MIRQFRHLAALWIAGNLVQALMTWAFSARSQRCHRRFRLLDRHRAAVALRQRRRDDLRCAERGATGLNHRLSHRVDRCV
jgi:hypothetical protein